MADRQENNLPASDTDIVTPPTEPDNQPDKRGLYDDFNVDRFNLEYVKRDLGEYGGPLGMAAFAESRLRTATRLTLIYGEVAIRPHPDRRFVTTKRLLGEAHATSVESCNCKAGLRWPDRCCIHRSALIDAMGTTEMFYLWVGDSLGNPDLVTCSDCGYLLDRNEAPLEAGICLPCALKSDTQQASSTTEV